MIGFVDLSNVIFLTPLVVSVLLVMDYAVDRHERPGSKVMIAGILGLSICMQFVPAMQVNLLIPLLIQVLVAVFLAYKQKIA